MAFALDNRGGGQALPPYLQGRKAQTQPMISPKSTVMPGEVAGAGANSAGVAPSPQMVPAPAGVPMPTPPMQGAPQQQPPKSPNQTIYDFYKNDLEGQRKTAMSNAVSDAEKRGVYYGTPLTTSQGDIETEYLQGLGTLQANMLQNDQQNELQRMQIAGNLLNSSPDATGGGIDPEVMKMLGMAFGGSQQAAGQRAGPVITPPKPPAQRGNSTQSGGR